MGRICFGLAIVAAVVGGCQGTETRPTAADDPDLRIDARDAEARYFEGTIISLRPTTRVMLISKGKDLNTLNIVECRWDPASRFYLDGKETDLTQLQRYMPVQVKGRMAEGRMVVEVAKFSSVLPANVKRGAPGESTSQPVNQSTN